MWKHLIKGLAVTISVVIVYMAFFSIVMDGFDPFGLIFAWREFWTEEHTLELQLQGSYEVDTSGIREYERIKKRYGEIDEDAEFIYFIQLPLRDSIMNDALEEVGLNFPEELLEYIAFSGENGYLLFSFGRELKEIKYKNTFYYDRIKAKITFCEEYQEDKMHVYFMKEDVFFGEAAYYVMKGSKRVFFGNNMFYTY